MGVDIDWNFKLGIFSYNNDSIAFPYILFTVEKYGQLHVESSC